MFSKPYGQRCNAGQITPDFYFGSHQPKPLRIFSQTPAATGLAAPQADAAHAAHIRTFSNHLEGIDGTGRTEESFARTGQP